jgi:primosomal protein N' (replication factor Y)
VAQHGAGTQRLEAELVEALAPMPIFRLDRDAARRKHGIAALLERFASAPSGVLVGTQMVAQGHDFPEVEVAVVQDADATLRFPDFRAEERTFALVAQLAGRSGRGPGGGRVLVQTMAPEARCLRHAARHDSAASVEEELARRRALGYPPFAHLIRVVTSASDQAAADATCAAVLHHLAGAALDVLGPAPLFRVKDRSRAVLVVKVARVGPSARPRGEEPRAQAVRAVAEAVQRVASSRAGRGIKFAVDVDPQ